MIETRPRLVAYLTAGFPTIEGFAELLPAVAAAADAIEIGVPFSDPVADGATIQRASQIALENGMSLRGLLALLRERPFGSACPAYLMSYLNPLLALGLDAVASAAAAAGFAGAIVPDLPLEESGPVARALHARALGLVRLVTPSTPENRLRAICRASDDFVYAVTVNGVTGGGAELPSELPAYLDRVRSVSPVPVVAGFGIRSAGQVRALAGHADGVVLGSVLMDIVDRGADPAAFLRSLRSP
jgi:tryptophan synthase alpha chain